MIPMFGLNAADSPRFRRSRMLMLVSLIGLGVALPLRAHEGHDHGAPTPSAATTAASAQPRFLALGDEFEVVGVLAADGMTLYLDETTSNRPIDGATLEIAGEGWSGAAFRVAPGTYRLPLKKALAPGKHALTLTVSTPTNNDLLATTLEIGAAVGSAVGTTAGTGSVGALASVLLATRLSPIAAGAAALLLGGVLFLVYRRRQWHRSGEAGK